MSKYGICKLNFYKKSVYSTEHKKADLNCDLIVSTINVICTNDFLHNFSRLLKFLCQLINTDNINAILESD